MKDETGYEDDSEATATTTVAATEAPAVSTEAPADTDPGAAEGTDDVDDEDPTGGSGRKLASTAAGVASAMLTMFGL